MQIGIFESEHFEVAATVIKLFDNGNNNITVFTFPRPHQQLKHLLSKNYHRYQWIVQDEQESKYGFIRRMYNECRRRNIQLLYLSTVSDNHLLYAWLVRSLPHVRVVLTLHDINSHFRFQPAFSLRRLVRYIGKRALVRSVKEFNVISETMVTYLQGRLGQKYPIYTLPGAVYEGTHHPVPSPAKTGKINIVVPGTVDVRRRDYNTVFQLLQACRQQALPVTVTLPGGYYGREGKEIINQCKAWAQQHDNLRFFETNLVDQPLFDQCMQESHVVLLPTRIETIVSDGVKETYGVSISSGTIFDVIRHAKPFIVPAALHIPGNLQSSAFRYHDPAAIIAFLQRLFSQEDYYADLCRQAVFNAAAYTIEKIRQQHPALLG
jgi:hypothetical protein